MANKMTYSDEEQWYILRQEAHLKDKPEEKAQFIKLLKADPEPFQKLITKRLVMDTAQMAIETRKAYEINFTTFPQLIVDAFIRYYVEEIPLVVQK